MRSLSSFDCLTLWESGRALHALDRALLAIHAALPEAPGEAPADWPLGRRNRALAELHHASFGAPVRGWSACHECREKLEFELDSRALIASAPPVPANSVEIEGKIFRLPTSRDLAGIAQESDPQRAAARLLQRCTENRTGAASTQPEQAEGACSDEQLDMIGQAMAQADPLAEILLHFDCPACGASFDEPLDLPSFLWAQIESRARRLLLEIHTLASAYGWNEYEILALSPARRNSYLEMVRA